MRVLAPFAAGPCARSASPGLRTQNGREKFAKQGPAAGGSISCIDLYYIQYYHYTKLANQLGEEQFAGGRGGGGRRKRERESERRKREKGRDTQRQTDK